MQGKTHFVVGTALALAILRPETASELVVGTGAAAVGSVISDIDSGHSNAGQDAAKVLALTAIIVILTALVDKIWNIGIRETFRTRFHMNSTVIVALLFVLILLIGILMPHRSFMHSLLGGALLCACLWKLLPECWVYFAIGFGSHLLLDLTNQRGEKLLFPGKKNYSLGWFKSNGAVNRILLIAGTAALAIVLYQQASPLVKETGADVIATAKSAAQTAGQTAEGWLKRG